MKIRKIMKFLIMPNLFSEILLEEEMMLGQYLESLMVHSKSTRVIKLMLMEIVLKNLKKQWITYKPTEED